MEDAEEDVAIDPRRTTKPALAVLTHFLDRPTTAERSRLAEDNLETLRIVGMIPRAPSEAVTLTELSLSHPELELRP